MQDSKLLVSGSISGTDNTITGQTVTGNGATVLSTYSVDMLANRDIGEGGRVYARVIVQTAASGGTSVAANIVIADDAGLTTNLTQVGTTGAIAVASLTAGAEFYVPIAPTIGSRGRRYLGLQYVTVGNVTAGAYIADFTIELRDPKNKAYASGFSVA